ncbi:MAG: gamma-glutamyltransferase, partial [Verrucomicrobia bacterium]|nr:gamma-glutamyltransferase [Verrucomicrobiota bacterium]
YDGRETAPATSTPDMFVRNGVLDSRASQCGALAVGVPGQLAVFAEVIAEHGRLPFQTHLHAAAAIAERGFHLPAAYAARIQETRDDLRHDPGCRALLLTEHGEPPGTGHLLLQRDLAASYRSIASEGIEWMYGGFFSKKLEEWMEKSGGRITQRDMAAYRPRLREPVRSRYRDFEIAGFPPPSSGGVHVAQILNILERFDLRAMGRESAAFAHVTAEAMKLAFADRAKWLGDPDFVRVPTGLAGKEYARRLSDNIRMDKALTVHGAGTPDDADTRWFGKHTTHFTAVDAAGWWVACTATINTSFGAKGMVPGTGILLNNQMDDFSAPSGGANFFGLVGGAANAPAPGKRPLSSMSPTLVLKDGKPVLTLGAAGGPTIISQVLLAILGVVDFDLSVDQALAAPRLHHQWQPNLLRIEDGFGLEVERQLQRLGHNVQRVRSLGACQAIQATRDHTFHPAADPRLEGKAAGR